MKKKIKKIKFGPYVYTVLYRTKLVEKGKKKDVLGRTCHQSTTVEVKNKIGVDMEKDVLLHESLHALWYVSGLSGLKKPNEEQIISTLTPWLLMLLRENPKLMERIQ